MYKERLEELFLKTSKHSRYQEIPKKLLSNIGENSIKGNKNRNEPERLNYILKNIDIKNKTVLDIGGNTGYFTFEIVDNGAKEVHYYEGNEDHAEFVRISSELLNYKNEIVINKEYFSFDSRTYKQRYDIALLLNVLHHLGDDYGDMTLSMEQAKKVIINQLNSLAVITKELVFQMGFNWKGDTNYSLFDNGTKYELINYIKEGTREYWDIVNIGVAESINNQIKYKDLNDRNINRIDNLGEFLNRPIFIMKSVR